MADLEDLRIQQLLRTIVREEVTSAIEAQDAKFGARLDAQDAKLDAKFSALDVKFTARFTELDNKIDNQINNLRAEFRAGFQKLMGLITSLQETVGRHSLQLRSIQTDLSSLKVSMREQSKETYRLAVLYEDLDNRFQAQSEL